MNAATIIEVRPSKKFKGAWTALEMPGVEPSFAEPDARRKALDYAQGRLGGATGEIRVYDDEGKEIVEVLQVDGRGLYPGGGVRRSNLGLLPRDGVG